MVDNGNEMGTAHEPSESEIENAGAIATSESGPSGGQGGDIFNDQSSLRNMATVPRLTSVVVQCEQYIDAIGFMLSAESINLTPMTQDSKVGWRDSTVDGPPKVGLLGMHGGPGGHRHVINMREGEFVEQISGRYGTYVDSLRIRTNLTTYPQPSVDVDTAATGMGNPLAGKGAGYGVGPEYGGEGGSETFSYTAPEGYQIIGLSGRAGQQLDALGVVMCARP